MKTKLILVAHPACQSAASRVCSKFRQISATEHITASQLDVIPLEEFLFKSGLEIGQSLQANSDLTNPNDCDSLIAIYINRADLIGGSDVEYGIACAVYDIVGQQMLYSVFFSRVVIPVEVYGAILDSSDVNATKQMSTQKIVNFDAVKNGNIDDLASFSQGFFSLYKLTEDAVGNALFLLFSDSIDRLLEEY